MPQNEAEWRVFFAEQERAAGVQKPAQPTQGLLSEQPSQPGPAAPTAELRSGDAQNPEMGSGHSKEGFSLADSQPAAGLSTAESCSTRLEQRGTLHTSELIHVENGPVVESGQPVSTPTPTGEVSAGGEGGGRPIAAPVAGQLGTGQTSSGAADQKALGLNGFKDVCLKVFKR